MNKDPVQDILQYVLFTKENEFGGPITILEGKAKRGYSSQNHYTAQQNVQFYF